MAEVLKVRMSQEPIMSIPDGCADRSVPEVLYKLLTDPDPKRLEKSKGIRITVLPWPLDCGIHKVDYAVNGDGTIDISFTRASSLENCRAFLVVSEEVANSRGKLELEVGLLGKGSFSLYRPLYIHQKSGFPLPRAPEVRPASGLAPLLLDVERRTLEVPLSDVAHYLARETRH